MKREYLDPFEVRRDALLLRIGELWGRASMTQKVGLRSLSLLIRLAETVKQLDRYHQAVSDMENEIYRS